MSGHDGYSCFARLTLECNPRILDRLSVLAHRDESSGEAAHHRVAEGICGHMHDGSSDACPRINNALPVQVEDLPHSGSVFFELAIAGEIVFTDECLRGLVHRRYVEFSRPIELVSTLQWIGATVVIAHRVGVAPPECREASVEVTGNRCQVQDPDVSGQRSIDAPCAQVGAHLAIEVRDLTSSVHPSIGSARAGEFDRFGDQLT